MANYRADPLDRAFAALRDPTRRAMLARLEAERELSISDLARPLAIKLPTVLKHLDVLGTSMGSPQDFAAMMRRESDKWKKVIDAANIKLD